MSDYFAELPELERIWLLLEMRRPQLAEQLARQRLAVDPTDWPTCLALAAALLQLGKLSEAREAAQAAIRLAPEAAEAHYMLAQVRGELGQLAEMVKAVDEALRLAPQQAFYYGVRAQLFFLQFRYAEAVGCAEAGLRIDPQQADCLLWRALAQEARDQPESADHDFARLLRVAPSCPQVHSRLGKMLLRRFDPQAADTHLTEALRQSPEKAPELVPLLQQARRQATWPGWLRQGVQREVSERALGLEPGYKALLVRLGLFYYELRANWLLRHDPLFHTDKLPLAHPWAARPWCWAGLAIFSGSFLYLCGLDRYPALIVPLIVAVRYMMARQKPSPASSPT